MKTLKTAYNFSYHIDEVEANDVIGTLTTCCTQVLKNGFKWLEFKIWLGELLEAPAVRREATDFQSGAPVDGLGILGSDPRVHRMLKKTASSRG